jgi:hypothetical protein
MVVAERQDIAHVAATSPTWAYRPIRTGCRPAPGPSATPTALAIRCTVWAADGTSS